MNTKWLEWGEIESELKRLAIERFIFLKQNKGFTKRIQVQRKGMGISIVFKTSVLGIEISLDYYDRYVNITLVKLSDSKLPPNYGGFVYQGNRVRSPLLVVLFKQLHVDDKEIRETNDFLYNSIARNNRDLDFVIVALDKYRDILMKYIDLILSEPLPVLFDF